MRVIGVGITYRFKKNNNRNRHRRRNFQTFFWIYFNKRIWKNVTDNQFTILEQDSENLVNINCKEVLDIISFFGDNLGDFSIGHCSGRKPNNKITYWNWCWNKIKYNYKIKSRLISNVFGIPKEVNIYGWRREVEFEQK